MFVYHIVLPDVWEEAKNNDSYAADSLAAEGFIHCSYEHQLDAVLGRYYSAKKVVILKLNTAKLTSELVEEPSTNNEIYPHIYGSINLDAVTSVEERDLTADARG